MSVCMHLCVHVHIHCIHILYVWCMRTRVPVRVWESVCIDMCICLSLCLWMCVPACVSSYMRTCMCVNSCMCVWIQVYMCVFVYMHAYMHMRVYVGACVCMYVWLCTHSRLKSQIQFFDITDGEFLFIFEEESVMSPVMCLRLAWNSLWSQDSLEWFVCLMSAGTPGVCCHTS